MSTVTQELYVLLDRAYHYFNQVLFDNQLNPVAITLQRKSNAKGYFQADAFANRTGEKANEIALNPDLFLNRTDEEILPTLAHEMCHHWQAAHGKPSRNSYHNAEFARKMAALGLICSNTGEKGGKKTGQAMTHYIDDQGLFKRYCAEFRGTEPTLNWGSHAGLRLGAAPISKVKYSCPRRGQNAWAKPNAKLLCGQCSDEEELIPLLSEG